MSCPYNGCAENSSNGICRSGYYPTECAYGRNALESKRIDDQICELQRIIQRAIKWIKFHGNSSIH